MRGLALLAGVHAAAQSGALRAEPAISAHALAPQPMNWRGARPFVPNATIARNASADAAPEQGADELEAWMPYAVDLRIKAELEGVGDADIPNVFHFVFGMDPNRQYPFQYFHYLA